jgi:glycosyltransferase involved in cell wall biosynthesis
MAKAARRLAGFRPDVAHAHSARAHALGVPAARMAGARAVFVSRRVAVPVGRHPASALKYRMPVDRYLCVSRNVRDTLRAAGLPESKLAVVPSGVSLEPPPPGEPLRTLIGAPAGAPVVGTMAALTTEKRHEDLLDAASEVLQAVPAVHFAWFGDGPRRDWLERRRAQLGLEGRVHLLGFRADARSLAAQCTVVALASELEGIATSLMEAQALGVPVVATAVGGVPEVVEDGISGRLVNPRDARALAAGIVEALTQPQVASAWVSNAQASVRKFHIDRTLDLTLAEYRAALGGGPGPA